MRLQASLKKWTEANLITTHQADAIRAYETQSHKYLFQTGLKYAGLLAVLLGVSLLVAANWVMIPPRLRLGGHIALNVMMAACIWAWRDNPQKSHLREGCTYLLSGLTLTLLALIGQTFQLQGSIGGLLSIWMILITPLVVLSGQNNRIVHLWAIGFCATLFYALGDWFDTLSPIMEFFVPLSLALTLPIALWVIGNTQRINTINPSFARMLNRISIAASIILAFVATLAFYDNGVNFIGHLALTPTTFMAYLLAITMATGAISAIIWFYHQDNPSVFIFPIGNLFIILPFILLIESAILSATSFIGLAVCLGLWAQKYGHGLLLNLCLCAITIRIFIIFLELFGSMLMTGWGLIIGGLVLMALVQITIKIRGKINA